jgi:hypothetical protein
VQEAGGEIISFEGDTYAYDTLSFVAATPNVAGVIKGSYEEIRQIIQ